MAGQDSGGLMTSKHMKLMHVRTMSLLSYSLSILYVLEMQQVTLWYLLKTHIQQLVINILG
jgi:hypothetical protein